MDQIIRPARPPQQQRVPVGRPPVSRRSKKWWIVGATLLSLLVVAAVLWHLFYSAMPRSDRYQAVFLDNGQVFFGKLKNTHGKYLQLDSAYYTKQQDVPADATAEQKAAIANNVSLTKVGDEVYGPENTVQIRAEQVLFWQDLQVDSKVSKAIDSAQ